MSTSTTSQTLRRPSLSPQDTKQKVREVMTAAGYKTYRTLALAVGASEEQLTFVVQGHHTSAPLRRKIERLIDRAIWMSEEEKHRVDHAAKVYGLDPVLVIPRRLLAQARALGMVDRDAYASTAELIEIAADRLAPAEPPPEVAASKIVEGRDATALIQSTIPASICPPELYSEIRDLLLQYKTAYGASYETARAAFRKSLAAKKPNAARAKPEPAPVLALGTTAA